MKNNILYVFLSFFFIIGLPFQSFSADDLELREKSEPLPNIQRLSTALSQIFGTGIEISDDQVTLKSDKLKLDAAIAKLNNFESLRQEVIPISSSHIMTRQCNTAIFSSWKSCLTSLGVKGEEISNLTMLDENGCVKIFYKPELIDELTPKPSDELTFNQKMANAYVVEIKKQSPYFNWVSQNNPHLIEITEDCKYLIINYGLLTDYFCKLDVATEQTDQDGVFTYTLSLQTILKRLTAAAGGDISLVSTSIPGQYKVRTVMLGGQKSQQENRVIEIVIDNSGSMRGDKIEKINKKMPELLQQFRDALQMDESLKVIIYFFNDEIKHYYTYYLSPSNQSPITWLNLATDGGTDLTKVGERMSLSSLDERKLVIAFTDGEHKKSPTDLNKSFKKLQEMQHNGTFAQPYFCRVGVRSEANSAYFSKISRIFDGSFKDHDNIDDFCRTVTSNIPYLLESNSPLVITLDGEDITIRQQDAHADIHVTSQIVKQGDAILHKGIRQYISDESVSSSTPSIKLETDEEKKNRLRLIMAQAQKELDEMTK